MILVAQDFRNSGTAIAWQLLRDKASALDAIEQGIRAVESNPDDQSVGRGGFPNAAGIVELDAGVMDGRTRASGAVASLVGYAHPVTVAYAVMRRLPHVLLVGEGAARFAAEVSAEQGDMMTEKTRQSWLKWQQDCGLTEMTQATPLIDPVNRAMDPWHTGGTTIYLAQDANGDIAAATSTSGWAWKYPGRLGDSPVAGAGFYADNRCGAAACTGMGELSIRTSLARMAVYHMQTGLSVADAVRAALRDVADLPQPHGDISLCAISARGDYHVGGLRVHHDTVAYIVATGQDEKPLQREVSDITYW